MNMNEIKKKTIIKLIKDFEKTRSIDSACTACDLLIEELNSGRLVL